MTSESPPVDAAIRQQFMDDWALAIGRFMVQFTSCEYWTYLYIKTFGSDRLREATGDLMLGARMPLAESLVLDKGLVPDLSKRVEAAFVALKRLAVTRNLIAHNGPMLHVYTNTEGKLFMQIELRSSKDEEKTITIARLGQLTAEARALDEEFAFLFGEVRQKKNHLTA